ncbi:uncharacterized protein LOC110655247 isoform X3 [Hevea brasiliensis]|uniref:uncharacterized protein LOC110655247 isoform X3 n=1 Tax=Hevea brasiliensis TaxID=3981 RepID=UPI0025E3FF3F|nr:uncharacterized protein LOC110655247 isoform X3 [Hevea brasiliensis]
MAASSPSSSSSSMIRTWRTAFLTLRDETLASSPKSESKSIGELLHNLIFSHSHSLISAAPDLPSHEVTSDLSFLLELAANSFQYGGQDLDSIFSHISHLMHEICHCQRVSLQINSSSWTLILNSSSTILQFFIRKASIAPLFSSNTATVKPAMECIETVRHLVNVHHQKFSLLDNIQFVKFLLCIVECSHAQLINSCNTSAELRSAAATGKRLSKYCSLWEVRTVVFTLLGGAFVRVGSSLPADIWQSTIKVLRKVMDALASKSSLVEDFVMSRFYASLLNSLHLVLMDPKDSLLDHVSSFVATLRMFFVYGLTSRTEFSFLSSSHKEKELSEMHLKLTLKESRRKDHAPYRPPHLRKKENINMKQPRTLDSLCIYDHESSATEFVSSDSDCSDSDGSVKDIESIQSSKVRVAAIVCIQGKDLCQADRKSFTTQWTILLPTNDVLQPRKFEATLMTCLLFDPYLKARIASASTLAVMLDGPSSVFLQVAEYKESTRCGSFMALSSSLGLILMQLHTGVLYLIQHETCSRMLPSLFKILMLLISSTPYSRMPGELLPTVITSLLSRTENGFPFKSDQTSLLATTINCLMAALSTSPPSPHVKEMLLEEISAGGVEAGGVESKKSSGVLSTLYRYSEHLTSSTICFEALQALRAVIHNYPNIAFACWEQISIIFSKIVKFATPEVPVRAWKGHMGENVGFNGEKVKTAAVKVLDECLRAISGFKGTEDLLDDKLLDTSFVSDCIRMKKVSSAPSYEPESAEDTNGEPKKFELGIEHWSITIKNHIPLIMWHSSAMVRTASLTCFAGITSSVFISLSKEKQEFVVSSLINAAVDDEVPSVRSAACRAIGVISCFPQISHSAEILAKFIHAIEINTHDPLAMVRITSSWAFANICDSLRHCINDFPLDKLSDSNANTQLMEFLADCALRLTKDGDKIKSNAVRALGNLSRFIRYTGGKHGKPTDSLDLSNNIRVLPASSNLHCGLGCKSKSSSSGDLLLLERMVQAFLSCVMTGNVKVQWNVCHALSNLFLNETLRLQDMDWAPSVFSVLLLLLRDSSNFKIRIQAAAALAVPASVHDVVQGLEHIIENLASDQIYAPSSFKYRVALDKQITSTMLHVLSFASNTDHQPLKDFLVKKASFLEDWLKGLCSTLGETSSPETGSQKKQVISKAIHSLIEVYESNNHRAIAQKFEKLNNSMQ